MVKEPGRHELLFMILNQRSERRLPVALPLLIHSLTSAKIATGCTLDITKKGARVQTQFDCSIGDSICIERLGKRALLRVIWAGETGRAKQRQLGLTSLEGEIDWGFAFPPEPDIVVQEPGEEGPTLNYYGDRKDEIPRRATFRR